MPNHPSWNYLETKQAILSIHNPGLQAYARIGYLLGGRIMENLPLESHRIHQKEQIILCTINTLKTRRGKYIYRELPNSLIDEPYYCQALIDFADNGTKDLTLKEYLGIGGKRSIENKLKRALGIVPHSFRHLRATHMGHRKIPSNLHEATATYLKYYFGWANIATANEYIDNLTIQDIMERYQKTTVKT